jgi:hypothetical protein
MLIHVEPDDRAKAFRHFGFVRVPHSSPSSSVSLVRIIRVTLRCPNHFPLACEIMIQYMQMQALEVGYFTGYELRNSRRDSPINHHEVSV